MNAKDKVALGYLINTFQKESPRLWEVLTKLNDQVSNLQDTVNTTQQVAYNWSMTIRLDGDDLTNVDDAYRVWPVVYLPRDTSNVLLPINTSLQFLGVNVKTAPANDALFDIQVSRDMGVNFFSIFQDPAALPFIPATFNATTFKIFAVRSLFEGDFIRIDLKNDFDTVDGLELFLLGTLNFGDTSNS